MLTADKTVLEGLSREKRLWQGIPSIAVTQKGTQFVTFYTGGVTEEIGNCVVLSKGKDGSFSEPIAAAVPEEGYRCFDPNVWIDPCGRLWLTWARFPEEGVFAAICENPDAEPLVFGEEFFIGKGVMMNKPIVLSTGEWMFPVAVWARNVAVLPGRDVRDEEIGSWAYVTKDGGKTFEKRGKADIPQRSFDEHLFLEKQNGSLAVFVRTVYGVGTALSRDGGYTWSEGKPCDIQGPCSRFYIGRLPSGRVLMVNHHRFTGRNNLTAFLSEDDGKTFSHTLLLDERDSVSYPDVSVSDGNIYIVYDRERGAYQHSLKDALAMAREILTAKITEEDILAEKLVTPGSYLKHIVSKLTEYKGKENPFGEPAEAEKA